MATKVTKKKEPKKPLELTLFFESEEDCINARDALGQTRRRPTNIDKTHGGSYSKMTGHYGQSFKSGATYKVPIRFKLIVDSDAYESLSWEERQKLKILDGDSSDWIAR